MNDLSRRHDLGPMTADKRSVPDVMRCPECGAPYTPYELENLAGDSCIRCFHAWCDWRSKFPMPVTFMRIGVPAPDAAEEIRTQHAAEELERLRPGILDLFLRLCGAR